MTLHIFMTQRVSCFGQLSCRLQVFWPTPRLACSEFLRVSRYCVASIRPFSAKNCGQEWEEPNTRRRPLERFVLRHELAKLRFHLAPIFIWVGSG